MNTRQIRPLASADIATLQAIDELQHGEAWAHRTFADEVEDAGRVHLVAEQAGTIMGHASAWIDGACCRVTNVAVAGDHAGNGHGSALLLSLLRAVLREHRVANVQLEVRALNRRAQRLYSWFGFVPVGVESNFYETSDERGSRDAVVMVVPDVCSEPWRERLTQIENDMQDSDSNGAAA